MDSKDKAKQLVSRFTNVNRGNNFYLTKYINGIEAAKICVDEILENINATELYHKDSVALPFNKQYWLEVKEELNLL